MFGIEYWEQHLESIKCWCELQCCEMDYPMANRVILHIYSVHDGSCYEIETLNQAIALAYEDATTQYIPEGTSPDVIIYKRAMKYLQSQTKNDSFIARSGTPW
jgi:hypothetical protein